MVKNAGHVEIQESGKKHIKFLTAWLELQLKNTDVARQVFTGQHAEIRNCAELKSIATKGL